MQWAVPAWALAVSMAACAPAGEAAGPGVDSGLAAIPGELDAYVDAGAADTVVGVDAAVDGAAVDAGAHSGSDSGSGSGAGSDSGSGSGSGSDSGSSSDSSSGSDSGANAAADAGADVASCDPDAKPQPNSGLAEAPGAAGCAAGMIAVAEFCIDKYEAALVEVVAGGPSKPWSPFWNPGKSAVRAVSIQGAVPQGYISGVQAGAACKAAGKRLCTDTEWLRACKGPAGLAYPYGKTLKPGVCNDVRAKHPAVEYFGTSAAWIWSKLGHPCIAQLADTVDPVGQNAGCVSAEGVLDMVGNVHEWTADPAGTFRGGFYVDTKLNGPGCAYATKAHDVGHWDYSTGFRCCADKSKP